MFILAKNNIRILLLLLFIGNAINLAAQIKPPLTDLQFKFGPTSAGGRGEYSFDHHGFFMGFDANFNISERVAIGSYFSRSSGEGYNPDYDPYNNVATRLFSYGLKMRFASGLRPIIRPYVEFTFGTLNFIEESSSSPYKFNGMTYGGSLGVMLKLNYHVYFVLALSGRGNTDYGGLVELSGGLQFNVGKRK